ncbi:MAG: hypothetical protein KF861_09090 [Planctomycetaceae bacterium]|nr:hypothetical protein [Planctomycetaceae bacterium]
MVISERLSASDAKYLTELRKAGITAGRRWAERDAENHWLTRLAEHKASSPGYEWEALIEDWRSVAALAVDPLIEDADVEELFGKLAEDFESERLPDHPEFIRGVVEGAIEVYREHGC